ncbi:hypothetical protein H8356DRAFT_1433771 [Neocallimastix lanati (nom. inval.)]|nr:hypothetical protein H8356DRAFT_1433771 [Neocallimastix sp. JGI-2020a]
MMSKRYYESLLSSFHLSDYHDDDDDSSHPPPTKEPHRRKYFKDNYKISISILKEKKKENSYSELKGLKGIRIDDLKKKKKKEKKKKKINYMVLLPSFFPSFLPYKRVWMLTPIVSFYAYTCRRCRRRRCHQKKSNPLFEPPQALRKEMV